MLTVIKDKTGEVIFLTDKEVSEIKLIDVKNELESFNPDEFIQHIRNLQEVEKKKNVLRFEQLKKAIKEKGFTLNDDGFLPEYTKEPCYGGKMGTVLYLEKDGLSIDIWANGEQRYNVFNDETFCRILQDEGVKEGHLSQEVADQIRKGIYYVMKLSMDGILPRFDYFNPVVELLQWDCLDLTDEEYDYVSSIDKDHYFELYINEDMYPDRMPIGWYVGYYSCGNNNWIEIFYDKDGTQLNDGEVYDGYDFLDALAELDEIYAMGLEYLNENK